MSCLLVTILCLSFYKLCDVYMISPNLFSFERGDTRTWNKIQHIPKATVKNKSASDLGKPPSLAGDTAVRTMCEPLVMCIHARILFQLLFCIFPHIHTYHAYVFLYKEQTSINIFSTIFLHSTIKLVDSSVSGT